MNISSSEEPGPTDQNPIPLNIEFEGPVDELDISDFSVKNGALQNLNRETPDFIFQDSEEILNFSINRSFGLGDISQLDQILEEELGDAVISIDYNSNNELFYLTLTNGIYKLGESQPVISGGQFDTPLDMIINRVNGNIIVADSEAGKVFIFDSDYNLIETIGNGSNADSENPRGATGLALDKDGNIYVADNFTGNTANQDAVKIYSSDGSYIDRIRTYNGQQIEDPFRIAVDNDGNIYVSESGGDARSPRVIIFDKEYNSIKSIEGGEQGNPGSLVVDNFGYLYVVDYARDFNLTDLLNEPLQVINNYETIKETKYTVNVFDTKANFNFIKKFDDEELNLPIDLSLNECGLININNLELSGPGPSNFFFGFPTRIDATFDFTLKTFQRQDLFTAEVVPENQGLVEVVLEDKDLFKCRPQPEGEFSIEYKIDEEETPPEATCNSFEVFLDANGQAQITAAQVYSGDEELELDIDIDSFNCSNLGANEVVLTVKDTESELSDSCTTTITVIDNVAPDANCIDPGKEFFLSNGTLTITVSDIDNNSTDNCNIVNRELSQSTFTTPGTKSITLTITDSSGQTDECTTSIEVIDNTPPQATCNNFEVFLDANGQAQITAAQVYSGDEELELNIDTDFFNCSNLGENEVELTVTDSENELSDTCIATITVIDNVTPEANCIAPGKEFFLRNGTLTITASDIDNNSADNCGIVSRVLSQSTFTIPGTKTVTLTVTDSSGKTDECETTIEILSEDEPYEFQCIEELTVKLGEDAQNSSVTEIPTSEFITSDISNLDLELTNQQFTCEDIGTNPLTIRATDRETGKEYSCIVNVTVEDVGAPLIICPADVQQREIPENGIFVLPEVVDLFGISDNCSPDEDLDIVQNPQVGTTYTEEGDYTITLTATDPYNNTETCEVIYRLTNSSVPPNFDCPESNEFDLIPLDEDCEYTVPDYTNSIRNVQNFEDLRVLQFNDKQEDYVDVTLEVYDGNTFIGECEFSVFNTDVIDPVILNCSDFGDEVTLNQGESYQLADYKDSLEVADCGNITINQMPKAGTPINETTEVNLSVIDEAGNTDTCSFIIKVISGNGENQAPVAVNNVYFTLVNNPINVPAESGVLENDNDPDGDELTAILVNDVSNGILDLKADGSFLYTPNSEFNGFDIFTYIATDGIDNSTEVTVRINIYAEENEAPLAIPDTYTTQENQTLSIDAPGVLENDSDPNGDSLSAIVEQGPSNGTLTLNEDGSFVYIPNTGFQGQDTFTYHATDGEGEGVATVTINVIGEPQGNVPPVAVDDEYEIFQDEELVVEAPGILANDSDANGDDLTSSVSQSTPQGFFTFNNDGSFTYVPELGFVGTASFTYTASDGELASQPATVIVNVLPKSDGFNFDCLEMLTIVLDENAMVGIQANELYTGNAAEVNFSLSKEEFTCDDIGTNTVRLSYEKDGEEGFCDIDIIVEDRISPVLQLKDLDIDLNAEGTASIIFEDINDGSFDNCDANVTYTLSKSVFSCKDLGSNMVQVLAEDSSGNTSSATTTITVNDNLGVCEAPPLEGSEYIFIYPNPNSGSFKIATPADITISRIEVFDNRGRFIVAKNFDSTILEYAMNLKPMQEGVYILKIVTNEETLAKRFIFKY